MNEKPEVPSAPTTCSARGCADVEQVVSERSNSSFRAKICPDCNNSGWIPDAGGDCLDGYPCHCVKGSFARNEKGQR